MLFFVFHNKPKSNFLGFLITNKQLLQNLESRYFMNRYIPFFDTHKIYEAIKWNYVVRDGKRVRKPQSTADGKHIEYSDNGTPKEVTTTGAQKTKMSKSAKKSARKSRSKKSTTVRKIAKSKAKRVSSW